jgi:hypothetical protein
MGKGGAEVELGGCGAARRPMPMVLEQACYKVLCSTSRNSVGPGQHQQVSVMYSLRTCLP